MNNPGVLNDVDRAVPRIFCLGGGGGGGGGGKTPQTPHRGFPYIHGVTSWTFFFSLLQ